MSDGVDGYYVGKTENPTSDSCLLDADINRYGGTLYFPYDDIYGYWLGTPSASDTDEVYQAVSYGVDSVTIMPVFGKKARVRPVVYIPSNIGLNTEGTVWTVEN